MNTNTYLIKVGIVEATITHKDVKNLHLSVLPPDGRVRITAPKSMSEDSIRLSIAKRIPWIKKQISEFKNQERQTSRKYTSGETHYFLGKKYRLSVVTGKGEVTKKGRITLELSCPEKSNTVKREEIMQKWYREQLHEYLVPIIEKWENKVGVKLKNWGIKRMKTKWGSSNPSTKRTWFNLELIKKPHQCIDYVVVHELVHLIERNHTDRFTELMNTYYPKWKSTKKQLSQTILSYEDWKK